MTYRETTVRCETCGGSGTTIEFHRFAGEYQAGEPVEVECEDCGGEGEWIAACEYCDAEPCDGAAPPCSSGRRKVRYMTHNQSSAQGVPAQSSPTGAAGAPDDRSTIFDRAIDALCAVQERRHAWLADAAAKIERWKAEDAAAGMPWDESQQGAGASANNAPGHIR